MCQLDSHCCSKEKHWDGDDDGDDDDDDDGDDGDDDDDDDDYDDDGDDDYDDDESGKHTIQRLAANTLSNHCCIGHTA